MAVFVSGIIVHVNEMRATSMISQGQITANGWSVFEKENVVVGEISGNLNALPVGVSVLFDCDISDVFFPNQGVGSPTVAPITEGL